MSNRQYPAPFECLEQRLQLNAAFDYVGITQLRADPAFAGIDGSGVGVAILDTGLDRTHPLLAGGYLGGTNIADGGSDPVDHEDHGTHVSGVIGARDPEIGVAPDAGLVGVKVLGDSGSGTFTDIRDGLRWVYDNRTRYNIQVVNMSLGGGFYTSVSQLSGDIVLNEIRRLEAAGITVVSAGGNSYKGHEFQNFGAPGIYSTLAVGATWKDGSASGVQWADGAIDYTTGAGRITSFSQRLVAPNTIFAPGAFIRSTIPGGRFENMGGTSQASPLVAGVVALMQEAARQFGGRSLSPAEVRDIVVGTAQSIFDGDDEDDNVQNTQVNYQRIDAYAALREVKRRLESSGGTPEPGGTAADPNGTLAGAYLVNPSLDGSQDLAASGRIGVDFGTDQIGATDVDVYRFATASSGTITITLSSFSEAPADFDSYLRLFNSAGTEIASNDNGPSGGFSQISRLLQPGTYFVGVSGKGNEAYNLSGGSRSDGATGAYTVTFSLSNNDPNGLLSGAVDVNFGTDLAPTTFQGRIGTDYGQTVGAADVDLFRVVAPDAGTLLIDIDSLDASGYVDSYLRLFDADGNQVAFSDDDFEQDLAGNPLEREVAPNDSQAVSTVTGQFAGHVTDSFVRVIVARGGTYYIGISDYANPAYNPASLEGRSGEGPGGTYTLIFRFISTDINGSIAQAVIGRAIPFEGAVGVVGTDTDPISGAVSQVGDKDVDFVRLDVSKASLIEIDVDSQVGYVDNPSPFDSVLFVFNSSGDRIAFNDDFEGLDPLVQFIAQPGTYYFAVAGFGNESFDPFSLGSGSPGETGQYKVSVRSFASSSVKTLSDDTTSFARVAALPIGTGVRGDIGSDGAFAGGNTDVDLYKFVATSDGVISVNADGFESFSADTVLRVFDSGGKELAFNDNRSADSRGSTVAAAVKKGKTYFVGVSGSGDAPQAYNPKKFGSARPGSTGSYELSATFNAPPTLTAAAALSLADAGQPFTITYDMLQAAANETDPEGGAVSFVISKLTSGTLTKDGAAVVAGQTRLSRGESLVWTPLAKASGATKAFTIVASDGVQSSVKPVQVSVTVNAAPTLTSVKDIKLTLPPAGTVDVPFATLLSAANEGDKNKDAVSFRIESVLSGELLINGQAVTAGASLFGPGQTLSFSPAPTVPGTLAVFTIRAYDGRLLSLNPITVRFKFA